MIWNNKYSKYICRNKKQIIMKKLILSILIVLSFNVQSQDTWEYRNDKRAHTLTGYTLGASMTNAMIQSGKYKLI